MKASKRILSHRIRLEPNNAQASFFARCAGASRFVWNLGLARWKELYEAGEKTSWQKINAEVNARKKQDLAWLYSLPCAITNKSLSDLGLAFSSFFRRVKSGDAKAGYPRFKAKKKVKPSFELDSRNVVFEGKRIRIPKLGWVKTSEELRFPGKICTTRITKHAGHWYVSVAVEVDDSWVYPHRCENQTEVVGIDLGVNDLAVLSDGTRFRAPRVLRKKEIKLRRLNKELSRRTKGGRNWNKTKKKLSTLHKNIADVRKDTIHKMTTRIVSKFGVIGVEDLCVKGMARTRLAKSIHDAAFSEVLRQLDYKSELAGSTLVKADRWFPSSKTCHVCGTVVDKLPLSVRQWTCNSCGIDHDRDDNAAQNLKNLAVDHTVTAYCHESAGQSVETERNSCLGRNQAVIGT